MVLIFEGEVFLKTNIQTAQWVRVAQNPVMHKGVMLVRLPWPVVALPAQETRYVLCSGTRHMVHGTGGKPTLLFSTNIFPFSSELKKNKKSSCTSRKHNFSNWQLSRSVLRLENQAVT